MKLTKKISTRKVFYCVLLTMIFAVSVAPNIQYSDNSCSGDSLILDIPSDQAYYSAWQFASRTNITSAFGDGFNNSADSYINAVCFNSTHTSYAGYHNSGNTTYSWFGWRPHSNYATITFEHNLTIGDANVTEALGIALSADSAEAYIVGHFGKTNYTGPDRIRTDQGFVRAIYTGSKGLKWSQTFGTAGINEMHEYDGESINTVFVDSDGELIIAGSEKNENPAYSLGNALYVAKLAKFNGNPIKEVRVPQEKIPDHFVSIKGLKIKTYGTGNDKCYYVLAQKHINSSTIGGTASMNEAILCKFDHNLDYVASYNISQAGPLIKRVSDVEIHGNHLYIVSSWANNSKSYGNIVKFDMITDTVVANRFIYDSANFTFDSISVDSDGTLYVGGTRNVSGYNSAFMAAVDSEDLFLVYTANCNNAQNHRVTSSFFRNDKFWVLGAYNGTATNVSYISSFQRAHISAPTLNNLPGTTQENDITLTWNLVSGALGYDVYMKTSPITNLASATKIASLPKGTFSYIDTSTKTDTVTYYYVVRSWNNYTTGTTVYSNQVHTQFITPMAEFTLNPSPDIFYLAGASYQLTWTSVPDCTYFYIYESRTMADLEDSATQTPIDFVNGDTNTKTLSQSDLGMYYYRIRAWNATRGNSTSGIVGYSIEEVAKSPTTVLVADNPYYRQDGKAVISWNHPDPGSDYTFHVWRYRETVGGPQDERVIAKVSGLEFTDQNIPDGTYFYYVYGENRTGMALTPSEKDSTIIKRLPEHPTPTLMSNKVSRDGTVKFTWTTNPGTTKIIIVRRFAGDVATERIDVVFDDQGKVLEGLEFRAELTPSDYEYSESGLKNGYWLYYVVATNENGARDIDPSNTIVVLVDLTAEVGMTEAMTKAMIIGGIILAVAVVFYIVYKKKVSLY